MLLKDIFFYEYDDKPKRRNLDDEYIVEVAAETKEKAIEIAATVYKKRFFGGMK